MIKRQKVALAEELSSDMSSHLFRATNQIQIHESMIRFFSTAKKGQKIPSELKLAEHYHVSRATIREVLQKLEFEGYLIRKKGSGTYLLNPPVNEKENLLYFFDIQSMIRTKGFLPSCDPVTIIRQPAGGYYAQSWRSRNRRRLSCGICCSGQTGTLQFYWKIVFHLNFFQRRKNGM